MMDLEQYKIIVEFSPTMVWRANLTTECDYFNKTWLDFTGRTFEQEYGFGWAEGVHPEDLDRCVANYLDHFQKQQKFEMNYRLMRHDGQYRWINDRGVPFYDKNNVFSGFIGSCMDITENIEGEQLRQMAQYDFLCNTYTRQYAYHLLRDAFYQAKEKKLPLSLLMIDIDWFKKINDQYGHAAGDTVLAYAASAIRKGIRDTDILGRYGGDEFIIGLVHTNQAEAIAAANRIQTDIAQAEISISGSTKINISFSIGIKSLESEESLDELVNRADQKLYDAKKEGRNQIKI